MYAGGNKMKIQTFKTILKYLEAEKTMKKDKLVATLEIEAGLSNKKAQEYIETLLTAKKIKINDEGVILNGTQ